MEFNCKYAKPNGEVVRAVLAGSTVEDVRVRLQDQGFLPLSVQPQSRTLSFGRRAKSAGFKAQDFIVFNQQFAALIRAGLPILRSLDLLKTRIPNPDLRVHIENVRDRVVSGSSLSDAMEQEGVFPTVYTASVFAGERSGDLVEVLNRYIRYEKTILSTRKKFRNALIYPVFLIVLSVGMVGVIVGFVIPRFAELYEGFDTALPVPTQMLLVVAGTIQSSLVVVLPALAAVLIGGFLWVRSESGGKRLDELKLKLPVLGSIWTMFSIAQLSRTLATLLQGGIPLVSALGVVRQASGNQVISGAVSESTGRVREGMSLSDALEDTQRFPDLALEMVRVGEQTGALPEMLNHVADFYDEDVDLRLAALLGWVEPVILIFVAVFVGFILIALYLPIFSLGQSPVF